VILFLHGDCSSAEEASAVIPHLHAAGLAQGKKYSIVSLDLPNNGYTETFPHQNVALSSETSWPGGLGSHVPLMTPILDFIENFVVAFVDALDQITPIKDRIAGVIGGSLGGNLGLRLGRRDFTGQKDWRKAIVSWSAASVWAPTVNDLLKSTAPGRCMKAADDPETPLSRADHFNNVYDKKLDDLLLPWTQPDTWYWKDWPFREDHIKASRRGRREIYNPNFRQWHWRLSAEQVIFSHVDRVDREVNNSPYRYELNTVLQLLCAAQDDNYRGANIFDATRTLANLMVTTPGRSMFLANTGHSMHVERPQFLASKIVDFFITGAMDPLFQVTCVRKDHGRITRLGGSNLTTGESFDLSEAECILSIGKGNEFFVLGADGSRAGVYVVAGDSSIYLSTSRDSSQADNLLSLPEC
jgi:pimeloyl-ACP methyl ester carboxylesterase